MLIQMESFWNIQLTTERQMPVGFEGDFIFNPDTNADFLFVHGQNYEGNISHIPKEKRILNITEKDGTFSQEYLDKFGILFTPYHIPSFNGIQIIGHAIHPWRLKIYIEYFDKNAIIEKNVIWSYKDFIDYKPHKIKKMSCIASNLQCFEYHKKRYEFMQELKKNFSDQIDFFGGGHNEIRDKANGLFDYKYAITMENSMRPNYFSEKLHDPYLAWCLPIYAGCSNIDQYFPEESYVKIDLDDFDKSLQIIDTILKQDPYDRHLPQIAKARDLILHKYNMPVAICSRIQELIQKGI